MSDQTDVMLIDFPDLPPRQRIYLTWRSMTFWRAVWLPLICSCAVSAAPAPETVCRVGTVDVACDGSDTFYGPQRQCECAAGEQCIGVQAHAEPAYGTCVVR